jgi:hypothetical protein
VAGKVGKERERWLTKWEGWLTRWVRRGKGGWKEEGMVVGKVGGG